MHHSASGLDFLLVLNARRSSVEVPCDCRCLRLADFESRVEVPWMMVGMTKLLDPPIADPRRRRSPRLAGLRRHSSPSRRRSLPRPSNLN